MGDVRKIFEVTIHLSEDPEPEVSKRESFRTLLKKIYYVDYSDDAARAGMIDLLNTVSGDPEFEGINLKNLSRYRDSKFVTSWVSGGGYNKTIIYKINREGSNIWGDYYLIVDIEQSKHDIISDGFGVWD